MKQPIGASQSTTSSSNECPSPITATTFGTRDFTGDVRQDEHDFAHPGVASTTLSAHRESSTAASPDHNGAALNQVTASEANLNYGFQPATPGSLWQWNNAMDFTNFNTFYDPQGQLPLDNIQNHQPARFVSDFNPPFRPALDKTLSQTPTPPALLQSPRANSVVPAASPQQVPQANNTAISGSEEFITNKKRKVDSDVAFATPALAASPGELPRRHSTTKIPSTSERMNAGSASLTRQPGKMASPRRLSEADPVASSAVPKAAAGDRTKQAAERGAFAHPKSRAQEANQNIDLRRIAELGKFNTVLPPSKVFPIQIGSELFRLSGASISSDSPSYFSHYFTEQLLQTNGKANTIKTLYIDRDPATFRDIALHLQGYHIKPRDGEHFIKLFADAQFYTLPRLTQQLFKSEIYIQVGDRHFRIPRDLFSSPGDSPNYFSLGFAHFFSTPSNTFPGLDQRSLLRPPSILPPSVPTRSARVFADLLHLLQGYDLKIRDREHRAELLRDARYFHLKGLEQRLIPCDISHNERRGKDEIVLRLEDIRQSGVAFAPDTDADSSDASRTTSNPSVPTTPFPRPDSLPTAGYITYQRPYVDGRAYELIIEIAASEAAKLDLKNMRATFLGQTKARISSLFQVVANKLNLPAVVPLGLMMLQSGGGVTTQPVSPANSGVSEDRVKIRVGRDCWVEVDGVVLEWNEEEEEEEGESSSESNEDDDNDDDQPMASDDESRTRKARARKDRLPPVKQWKTEKQRARLDWTARSSQWRVRVEEATAEANRVEVVMEGVRIEAFTQERSRNGKRGFLTP